MNRISFTYPSGIEDHPKIIFISYFQSDFTVIKLQKPKYTKILYMASNNNNLLLSVYVRRVRFLGFFQK